MVFFSETTEDGRVLNRAKYNKEIMIEKHCMVLELYAPLIELGGK